MEEYCERPRIMGCRRADLLYDMDGVGDRTHKKRETGIFHICIQNCSVDAFHFLLENSVHRLLTKAVQRNKIKRSPREAAMKISEPDHLRRANEKFSSKESKRRLTKGKGSDMIIRLHVRRQRVPCKLNNVKRSLTPDKDFKNAPRRSEKY